MSKVSAVKRIYISTVMLIIIALSIWFIILDFSRFFSLSYNYDIYPSGILKRINVVLAVSIAWAVGKNGLNSKDSNRMKAALLFACLGEAAFALRERAIGICFFAICQIFLTIRNSTGLNVKLAYANHVQKKRLLLSGLIILSLIVIIVFSILLRFQAQADSSAIVVLLYGIVLSASLWSGLSCNILGLLPVINSKLTASGIICFYCCDILVGLDAVLEAGLPWLLANSFIWIFYIPALVLLSLSCYRYV